MSNYLAVVGYTGPEATQIQLDYVGTFDSEDEANQALEEFIEGDLEIERPGYQGLVTKIFRI